ncbi:MAG: hypothetical protein GC206_05855 [Alphaproteobacteria bacterium]|nr:hypothetical protein [Alphaproteobacteria bacterium]
MQYALFFAETPAQFAERTDPAKSPAYWGAWTAFIGAMREAGVIRNGDGLQAPHTATTVRLADGKRIVQDGPFADAKEQLGGYLVIEADTLDAALDWAAKAPCAAGGAVEVRPVLPPMPPQ